MLPLVTKLEAERLKEEGFDLPVRKYFHRTKSKTDANDFETKYPQNHNADKFSDHYSAPTVSEALLWLGDNKGFEFSNWAATRYKNDKSFEMINTFYTAVLKGNCSKCENFDTYNSRLFQSKQLSMALEILKSEKPTK